MVESKDWDRLFRKILQLADEPLLWKICVREPLSKLQTGKLVVRGDAPHPQPPYRDQGVAQATEGGAVLEMCLGDLQAITELLV